MKTIIYGEFPNCWAMEFKFALPQEDWKFL